MMNLDIIHVRLFQFFDILNQNKSIVMTRMVILLKAFIWKTIVVIMKDYLYLIILF